MTDRWRQGRSSPRSTTDAPSLLLAGSAAIAVLLLQVRDRVRARVFAPKAADHAVRGFAGFGHGVVARVEVFALFELVLEEVFLVGEFAVEAEELLFFFCEGL